MVVKKAVSSGNSSVQWVKWRWKKILMLPEMFCTFCKGFIHEKEFPENGWRRALCMD